MTRLSPYHALIAASLGVMLVLLACIALALQAPRLSPSIHIDGQHILTPIRDKPMPFFAV